jgi:hypothetical protein
LWLRDLNFWGQELYCSNTMLDYEKYEIETHWKWISIDSKLFVHELHDLLIGLIGFNSCCFLSDLHH